MAKKKVIFLGRKRYAAKALQFLIQNDIQVSLVVAPEDEDYQPSLASVSEDHGIPIISVKNMYKYIDQHKFSVDLVISYLFWKKIFPSLYTLGKQGCVNYHPAILPNYKGLGGYNLAILHNLSEWGSSVHYIDSDNIDSGPIIEVKRFKIDPNKETAYSLEKKTQNVMYKQFCTTILDLIARKKTRTIPNTKGHYFSKKDYNLYKLVDLDQPLDVIERKVRAFWFPPYDGAYIEKSGTKITLVTSKILKDLKI